MERRKYLAAIAVAVPVLLAIALAAVSIWSAGALEEANGRTEALSYQVQASYQNAMYQLSDNVNDIQTNLRKLSVAGSPARHITLLSDVWRLSGAAVANMAILPNVHGETADLNAFLVRVGDYANVLSGRILSGAVMTDEDYAQLNSLYEASVTVGNELAYRLENGDIPTQALSADGYYGSAASSGGGEGGDGGTEQPSGETQPSGEGGDGDQKSEESISDYPTLIYDGPFSESNEKPEPRGLGKGECGEEGAKSAALEFLGGGQLTFGELEEGTIPVYTFYGKDPQGRGVEMAVTRTGGKVQWMMCEAKSGQDGVPGEEMVERMKRAGLDYLTERGYKEMEATYAQFYDGVGVFNFACVQEGVILYGDLIKVYVERDSCAVVGVDATNYLMSHAERQLQQPLITREEAAQSVGENLSVQSVRLALIPKTPSSEILCYEFKGTAGGGDFIVYINARTGAEEEIFEIINSEEGQLVV